MKNLLQQIPGIGPSLAADLNMLGVQKVEDLVGANPQGLYNQLCRLTHSRQDPCVLYAFRCAVHYAEGGREPDKLKWWNWKNEH